MNSSAANALQRAVLSTLLVATLFAPTAANAEIINLRCGDDAVKVRIDTTKKTLMWGEYPTEVLDITKELISFKAVLHPTEDTTITFLGLINRITGVMSLERFSAVLGRATSTMTCGKDANRQPKF